MPETTIAQPGYQRAIDFLFSRIDYERASAVAYGRREFRLDRMRELLARLDNPQKQYPIVHIAGTKGKGSTGAMIASILTAAGRRTGLYSSPHLERVEERIAIDGAPCLPDELASVVERVRRAVEAMDLRAERGAGGGRPTYFEVTTAMALVEFAQRRAAAAVVEVGLGGRLDSTNVCQPVVSVITSISFDHMKQLGNTLASIAREKAGIIKPGVPVVSGVREAAPRSVIAAAAQQRRCRLWQLGEHFDFSYTPPRDVNALDTCGRMNFIPQDSQRLPAFADLQLGLLGEHQAANAAVAIAVVLQLRDLGWAVPETAVREGLAAVRCPARVEVVARGPAVIVDAGHNVASIESLVHTMEQSFAARKRWLIFATTQDKQVREMLALLLPRFDGVVLTRYLNNPRYVPVDELAAIAKEISDGLSESNGKPQRHGRSEGRVGESDLSTSKQWIEVRDCPAAAWQCVRAHAAADDLICATGSFFLAAEMRALFFG